MARGITAPDVFAAADTLLAQGERPTIERVRQHLGRGSPNTVNRLLDDWWRQLSRRVANKPPEDLPGPLAELCKQFYAGMKKQATLDAAATIAEYQQQAVEAQAVAEQLRQTFATDYATQQALAADRKAEVEQLQARTHQLVERVAELEAQLVVARDRATAAEKASQQAAAEADRRAAAVQKTTDKTIAAKDRRIAELQGEVEKIRGQWQGNEAHWLKQIDHLRDDFKKRQADFDRQRTDLQARLSAETKAREKAQASVREMGEALANERRDRILDLRAVASPAAKQKPRPTAKRNAPQRGGKP